MTEKKRFRGNAVSFGHVRLFEWAEKRGALGRKGDSVVGRMMESAGIQPGGTHGNPTLSQQIVDEPVYNCEAAIAALARIDDHAARAVVGYYIAGHAERVLAERLGVTRQQARDLLVSGQAWIGSWLLREEGEDQGGRESTTSGRVEAAEG